MWVVGTKGVSSSSIPRSQLIDRAFDQTTSVAKRTASGTRPSLSLDSDILILALRFSRRVWALNSLTSRWARDYYSTPFQTGFEFLSGQIAADVRHKLVCGNRAP